MIQSLRSRASFDALARNGRRRAGRYCWLRWAPLPPDHSRAPYIGYAIGRSVGPAVVRNRIRRRLRAILASSDELEPGLYLVGVRSAQAATVSFDDLRYDLLALVAKLPPTHR